MVSPLVLVAAPVSYACERVAVMYVGKVAEMADGGELFANSKYACNEALLPDVPNPIPHVRHPEQRIVLGWAVADPANPADGC